MNWEAIGAVSEGIGAAAVVASLVYLGFQIHLFRGQQKADALRDVLKEHQNTGDMLTRGDLARVINRGVVSFDSLSASEMIQFNGFWIKYLYSFLSIRDHYQAGNVGFDRFEAFEKDLACCMLAPGMKTWWAIMGGTHLELKEHVDTLMARYEGTLVPYTDYFPGWQLDERDRHPHAEPHGRASRDDG